MSDDALTGLIESSDIAGLLQRIDGICGRRAWDELIELRDRCEEAVERGKQLWAVSQFAEYRLALEGPPERAATVLSDGRGRFSLGPLWEVAASSHTWADLQPHLSIPTVRAMIGHERSIRGDTVAEDEVDGHVLGIPVLQQMWEPNYPVAEYRPDRAAFPDEIFDIDMQWVDLPDPVDVMPDDSVCDALLELVKPWWEDSLGKAEAVTVDGTIEQGIRALGPRRVRMVEVPVGTAMEAMTWAGASGGSHGRRRGTPAGRTAAWWVVLEALGYDDVPEHSEDLGDEGSELRWVLWDPGDRVGGWNLHIGIEDHEDGVAWILSAVDAV
ncbi:MAG: hypothetical protein ACR2N7_05795 [Acidimicrobiia bacterium]